MLTYGEAGLIRTQSWYADHKLEGEVVTYDANGQITSRQPYRDGQPLGPPLVCEVTGDPQAGPLPAQTPRWRQWLQRWLGGG